MKITEIRTIVVGNPWKNWIYVVVDTDDGFRGLGEATGGLSTQPTVAAVEEVKHMVIGRDPRDIHAIWNELYLAGFLNINREMSGIEMACWDILGKSLNVPVHRLLGGKVRDDIRVYANGWYSGPRTPEGFADSASEVVAKGYTALKLDPFGTAYLALSRSETREVQALLRAVRDAVGDDVEIMIEAHDRFSVGAAIEIGNWLEEFDVTWFETPVLSNDVDALIEVAKRVPVRVIAGERMHELHDFARFLNADVTDIINPEPLGVGGVWRTLQIAGMARAHHAQLAPHNAESPLKTMIALHIDAVTPNIYIQECFDDFAPDFVREAVIGFPRVKDGYFSPPEAPGLGIDLNLDVIKEHPYRFGHFNLFADDWQRRAY